MDKLIFSSESIRMDTAKILNHLPHAILIKDSSSNFIAANHKVCELTGFKKPSEMIGLNDSQLNCAAAALHEDIMAQDRCVLEQHNQFFLDMGYYGIGRDLKILYTSKIKIIDEDNRPFVLVSTTEIPLFTMNNVLLSLMDSLKEEKRHAQSYHLKTDCSPLMLTEKQSECLFYLLRGKKIKEIALILQRSSRTIEDHVELLKFKFDCFTKSQLIEKAFQLGFGQIIPPTLLSI